MVDNHSEDFKREIVSLFYYSGNTLEEIAEATNIPINTLKHWIGSININSRLTSAEKQTIEALRTDTTIPAQSEDNQTYLGTWMESLDETTLIERTTAIAEGGGIDRFQFPVFDRSTVVSTFTQKLGEGGMGVVHSAVQNSMGRQIAVKEIRPDVASPHTIRILLQEAWITGFLEHPNIIPVYDISENERGEPIILMKEITGKNWASFLEHPELIQEHNQHIDPLMWHLDVLDQVCRGVHYAHSRGIIHRDLKPENIMIGDHGEVYILDWGIALALDDRHAAWIPRAPDAKGVAGSPWYMAPEMVSGDGRLLSVQTDVYLLGAILYEIVTGEPPHKGPTLQQILKNIPNFEPVFLDGTCPTIQEIIQDCLQKNPQQRPKCVNTLRLAIQSYRDYREINGLGERAERELGYMSRSIEREDNQSRIFSHYFAARFGLEQIRKSPLDTSHLTIEEVFHEASLLLIDWCLAQKNPDSALILLKYLQKQEPEYKKRIKEAIEHQEKEAEYHRKLHIERSETIGVRTRAMVILFIIFGWLTHPIITLLFDLEISYRSLHIQTFGMQIWLFAIGIWARDSLSSTELNRKTYLILLVEPLMHLVADLAAYAMGWPAEQAWALRFIVWSMMLTSYAFLIDIRFIGVAVVYSIISVYLFVMLEYVAIFSVAINLLLLGAMIVISRPAIKQAEDARELK